MPISLLKFLNKENNTIICFFRNKKKEFWDFYWIKRSLNLNSSFYKLNSKSLIIKITTKYLKNEDGPILEGGCGLANNAYNLDRIGYDVIGIDNAIKTIDRVKKIMPSLKVEYGDVRKTRFQNNYFAGYWSIGVIEHFFKGYFDVIKEIKRILKPEGYLFITFPYMNYFRKIISKFNLYKIFNSDFYENQIISENFYQFILDKDNVIKDLEEFGFDLKHSEPLNGIKGLKDEIFFLKFFLQKFLNLIYNTRKPIFVSKIKGLIDLIFKKYTGHSILLIFQKK